MDQDRQIVTGRAGGTDFVHVREGDPCGENGPVLIVTPNPAVDHTVWLTELRPGEVIRTGPGLSVAGGKGANVARAAACLGVRATVLALLPETGGDHLRALYAAEGFDLVAVPVTGRVRTCTALLEDGGRVTLLNEPGAELDPADWDRLMVALEERLARAAGGTTGRGDAASSRAGRSGGVSDGPVLCSGSLPPGAPADGYARVVAAAHRAGREVLVDASGEPLALAAAAGADLLCPNLSEAESVLAGVSGSGADRRGSAQPNSAQPNSAAPNSAQRNHAEPVDDRGADVPHRAAAAAAGLRERGARWAAVTAGSAGVAIAGPGTQLWLPVVPVSVRNPIGAGDSFLAGVATARLAGADWPDAVRRGLAAGSASVEQDRAGMLDPARVSELERLTGDRRPGPHRSEQSQRRGTRPGQ
jgi:fructose-1-phosphate kinase PfkB-like protein